MGHLVSFITGRLGDFLLRKKMAKVTPPPHTHNDIHLKEGALFYRQVYAGRYSYGRISVVMFNTVDRLLIGDFVSIANGCVF